MAKISPRKVSGPEVDGYTETIMFEVLACGNVGNNNNKFYCIELQRDPSTDKHRLFTHYGRIGKTNVYEIRDTVSDRGTLEAEYNKILKKKKSSSGSSKYEQVETNAPTVGSYNIRDKKTAITTSTKKGGELSIIRKFDDSSIKMLLSKIWDENIHNITNLTTMSVTASGIASPLGPLTLNHINAAAFVLDEIKNSYSGKSANGLAEMNAQYFSMIPHPFGHKIPADAIIDDDNKFMVEYDLLEQMKATLQVTDDNEKEDDDIDIPFTISPVVKSSDIWDVLESRYINSRAACHGHLRDWNIANIFQLDHNKSTSRYEDLDESYKETEYDLFHGSRACNILSIMMNGLMIPPSTAGHVTGRMFGDGIYGASASTKALNYATGYWAGGVRNRYEEAYMFVVRFAMGKVYYPTRPMYNGPPSDYDSIWAKKEKTSLANDEFIVYRLDQAKITHLLQLRRK